MHFARALYTQVFEGPYRRPLATPAATEEGMGLMPTFDVGNTITVAVGLTAAQLPLGSPSGQTPIISGVLKID